MGRRRYAAQATRSAEKSVCTREHTYALSKFVSVCVPKVKLTSQGGSMIWDWGVIGTVVGGFSTLIYTGFTYALLRENRVLRKAGSEPRLVAHFDMHPAGNGALLLKFSNVGTGPALDVSFSLEYDDGDFENYELLFKYGGERPAITLIGQGQDFSFLFAIGFQLFRPKNAAVSERLKPFQVELKWRSVSSNKIYSEKYLLDVSAYDGLPGLFEKPPIIKIVEELQGISKHFGKLVAGQSTSLYSLDLTSLEQSTRNVMQVHPPTKGAPE